MARHGKDVVRPVVEFENPHTGRLERWEPVVSSTRYSFEIGQEVELLVAERGDWREFNDIVSIYFLPSVFILFGGISGVVLFMLTLGLQRMKLNAPLKN